MNEFIDGVERFSVPPRHPRMDKNAPFDRLIIERGHLVVREER
jgi:hypothetical protein